MESTKGKENLMYGKKRYRQVDKQKQVVSSIQIDPSVPTYLCAHCKQVNRLEQTYATLNLSEYNSGHLTFSNYKLCPTCKEFLNKWLSI